MSFINHQTKVRNMSGRTQFFGYLGRHGVELADGEEMTLDGDLLALLSNHKRKYDSYKADLESGDLAVVSTPAQHFYDETLDVTKVLKVDNNTVSAADPAVGAYSSSAT